MGFSYLVISCLEEKGWLSQGSKNIAWDAVQNCWSTRITTNGQVELVSRRIAVVYGIEYEVDEDGNDDEDDDHNSGSVAPPNSYQASDGRYYPVPNGAYLASDGRIYPRPGYYLASDGRYYPEQPNA
tara:strand:- start:3932 stop:4312 length:381 start_codon:yes stop_codon:yes gene_type:complete